MDTEPIKRVTLNVDLNAEINATDAQAALDLLRRALRRLSGEGIIRVSVADVLYVAEDDDVYFPGGLTLDEEGKTDAE